MEWLSTVSAISPVEIQGFSGSLESQLWDIDSSGADNHLGTPCAALGILCVCLSVCLFVFLSVCLFVCLSVCLFVCLSFCLFVCLSVCLLYSYKNMDKSSWR